MEKAFNKNISDSLGLITLQAKPGIRSKIAEKCSKNITGEKGESWERDINDPPSQYQQSFWRINQGFHIGNRLQVWQDIQSKDWTLGSNF